MIRAVLWDFGGVILSSPFEAFNAYEECKGLPTDFIRSVNATDPDRNAWALLERTEIDGEEFVAALPHVGLDGASVAAARTTAESTAPQCSGCTTIARNATAISAHVPRATTRRRPGRRRGATCTSDTVRGSLRSCAGRW